MSVTAVIPVRAGSTRVKNKNIRSFAGSSLLEIKINQLKSVKGIDRIIVSSDSDEMLALAMRCGVEADKRPDEYCDEKTKTFNEVVRYIAGNVVKEGTMIWAPCVCPMVTGDLFEQGIELYKKILSGEEQGDSVVTASLIKEYLFDEQGPVNFSIEHHVPSQRLPNWHYITNGFFIAEASDMEKWGFVYGPNPRLFELNKFQSIDIDDEYDFAMAEFAYDYMSEKAQD